MSSIKNHKAAVQARKLSKDYFEAAISKVQELPNVPSLPNQTYFGDLGISYETQDITPTIETFRIYSGVSELPSKTALEALKELTSIQSPLLNIDQGAAEIEKTRSTLTAEFRANTQPLLKPAGIFGKLPGFKKKRRTQLRGILEQILVTVSNIPIAPRLFADVLNEVLRHAGFRARENSYGFQKSSLSDYFGEFTSDDLEASLLPASLRESSHKSFQEFTRRRKTILAWVFEAVSTNNSASEDEMSLCKKLENAIEKVEKDRRDELEKKEVADRQRRLEFNALRHKKFLEEKEKKLKERREKAERNFRLYGKYYPDLKSKTVKDVPDDSYDLEL